MQFLLYHYVHLLLHNTNSDIVFYLIQMLKFNLTRHSLNGRINILPYP